ncbi:NUDIX hydrolase [Streptomyces sp. NPDC058000]|uniref:NUDIX hydrolase n=1 Tax=Streptomyces sp. NPDC058000 TaxID=3346299 RepID=UPI0036E72AEE
MTTTRNQFTDPDGRRIGALALFCNPAGHPLMLRKRDRDELPWCLPGGCAVGGESALAALRRKVLEETGLHATPGLLLVKHYMPLRPRRRRRTTSSSTAANSPPRRKFD